MDRPPDGLPDNQADSSHSIEAEEAVIGALLLNPSDLVKVSKFLQSGDFYLERNGAIYESLLSIRQRGEQIGKLTLTTELSNRGLLDSIGGAAYITHLVSNTPSHIRAETYGHMVERLAIRRRLGRKR